MQLMLKSVLALAACAALAAAVHAQAPAPPPPPSDGQFSQTFIDFRGLVDKYA